MSFPLEKKEIKVIPYLIMKFLFLNMIQRKIEIILMEILELIEKDQGMIIMKIIIYKEKEIIIENIILDEVIQIYILLTEIIMINIWKIKDMQI